MTTTNQQQMLSFGRVPKDEWVIAYNRAMADAGPVEKLKGRRTFCQASLAFTGVSFFIAVCLAAAALSTALIAVFGFLAFAGLVSSFISGIMAKNTTSDVKDATHQREFYYRTRKELGQSFGQKKDLPAYPGRPKESTGSLLTGAAFFFGDELLTAAIYPFYALNASGKALRESRNLETEIATDPDRVSHKPQGHHAGIGQQHTMQAASLAPFQEMQAAQEAKKHRTDEKQKNSRSSSPLVLKAKAR